MHISLDWLSEFVELPSVAELCETLIRSGVAVDAVSDPAEAVAGVVVAEVQACEPHPKADRLKLCTVFDGAATARVVCGANNVAPGVRVPLARLGARLPDLTIERRAIRGIESEGMLCSKTELGLEESSAGLWLLPAEAQLGKPIFEAVPMAARLTLDVTPNRPDLLSHAGVAREAAAALGRKLKSPSWRVTEKGAPAASLARVLVEDPKACRRYVARVVTNVTVGPSPAWLRARLERVGMRSINNVVDVTNYVLMELGQPLHAFDLAKIGVELGAPTVRVRRAKPGESLATLDGKERALDAEDLVIADVTRPMALAGVMGGADSEVSASTTAVLIESAWFDPVTVRRAAKRHGMSTEASKRFERGADLGLSAKAADRCAQLIAEVAGGEVAKGLVEVAAKSEGPREITVRMARVERLLGLALAPEAIAKLLEPLEIRVVSRNEVSLRFEAPTFRPDLVDEIDLIEEIARRYGYDNIEPRMPGAAGSFRDEPMPLRSTQRARAALVASGLSEIVTYGFGSPSRFEPLAEVEGSPLRIINPLGEELSALRTSLIPGMLEVVARNQRHGARDLRLFEVGPTFHPRTPKADEPERDRYLPREDKRIVVALTGGRAGGAWYERGEVIDFADLAGVVDTLVEAFDPAGTLSRTPAKREGLHPHCAARLSIGAVELGVAGRLHPDWAKTYGLDGEVYVAELSVTALESLARRQVAHAPPAKFPGTRRDLAVVAPRTLHAEAIRSFIATHAGGRLGPAIVENVRLFDVYRGKPIPEDRVSLAFAIDYKSRERTLTDAEVGEAFEAVVKRVAVELGVEIRQ